MDISIPSDADKDDPWTFFGSFSEAEIAGAVLVLKEASVRFEVKKDEKGLYPQGAWSGPFALWVLDDDAARASAILVPHFQAPR